MGLYSKKPKQYRGKQVSSLLKEMIQEAIAYQVHHLSKKWAIEEGLLAFYVHHYNPKKEKNGESELKHKSDCKTYTARTSHQSFILLERNKECGHRDNP